VGAIFEPTLEVLSNILQCNMLEKAAVSLRGWGSKPHWPPTRGLFVAGSFRQVLLSNTSASQFSYVIKLSLPWINPVGQAPMGASRSA
jgi:hypothetical protein